jgi:hypothetical protein
MAIILIPMTVSGGVLHTIGRFVTHHTTIAVMDYASSHAFSYYNGTADAIFWGYYNENHKQHIYGAKPERWHYYKNMAQLMLVVKGFTIGVNMFRYLSGDMPLKTIVARELFLLPAMKFTWDGTYNMKRHNDFFYQKNYVIPAPGIDDIKIQLQGKQIDVANFIEITTGFFIPLTTLDKFYKF